MGTVSWIESEAALDPAYRVPPYNVALLTVEDVDAPHALRRQYGIRIIKGPRNKDYGLRAFVFQDLDGNRIDVGQPI